MTPNPNFAILSMPDMWLDGDNLFTFFGLRQEDASFLGGLPQALERCYPLSIRYLWQPIGLATVPLHPFLGMLILLLYMGDVKIWVILT